VFIAILLLIKKPLFDQEKGPGAVAMPDPFHLPPYLTEQELAPYAGLMPVAGCCGFSGPVPQPLLMKSFVL
jgi:hypothetical protein